MTVAEGGGNERIMAGEMFCLSRADAEKVGLSMAEIIAAAEGAF